MAFLRGEWSKIHTTICAAAGIDPRLVHRIVIDLTANDMARVLIEQYLTVDQDNQVAEGLKTTRWELVEDDTHA